MRIEHQRIARPRIERNQARILMLNRRYELNQMDGLFKKLKKLGKKLLKSPLVHFIPVYGTAIGIAANLAFRDKRKKQGEPVYDTAPIASAPVAPDYAPVIGGGQNVMLARPSEMQQTDVAMPQKTSLIAGVPNAVLMGGALLAVILVTRK